jgi:hypothetical protein
MRFLITTLITLALASGAIAEKPVFEDNPTPVRIDCPFDVVMYDWDFGVSNQGFTHETCDATGGVAAWEWGNETHFGNCWGTVLAGNYPNSAGDALVSPSFLVTDGTSLMQVSHLIDVENNYDGGNVVINDAVVAPMEGYTVPIINTSTAYYAFCVDGDPGWTGRDQTWTLHNTCFDLSPYIGQTISVKFQFGSDSSVAYSGWYIKQIKVGGDTVATEQKTWSTIKSLYR